MPKGSLFAKLIIPTVGYNWKSIKVKSAGCLDHSFPYIKWEKTLCKPLLHRHSESRKTCTQDHSHTAQASHPFPNLLNPRNRISYREQQPEIWSQHLGETMHASWQADLWCLRSESEHLSQVQHSPSYWASVCLSVPSCHFHVSSHCLDSPWWTPFSYSLSYSTSILLLEWLLMAYNLTLSSAS